MKGHTFDLAHHLPFVASWPTGITRPGRRVDQLVSMIDIAPTVLELMQVDSAEAGMASVTGRSFTDLLKNRSTKRRPFVLIGRERNDVNCRPGSPSGLGYPARAIREGNFLYVHNFAPDRWPCGNPEIALADTDDGPTKSLINNLGQGDRFWQLSFGKRPESELYDLSRDPDCVNSLAAERGSATRLKQMRERLLDELKRQNDPRAMGMGDAFDQYVSPRQPVRAQPRGER